VGAAQIVNVSSGWGMTGAVGVSFYVATKHAILGLTRSAALEFARQGVRINAVCPGGIKTGMVEEFTRLNPELTRQTAEAHPIGRISEPEESESTLRSYSVDLLRWWRFLDAVGVEWDRVSRAEARDFSCWIQLTAKQRLQTSRPRAARLSLRVAGAPNPVTGKPASGEGYAPSTVAHSETVLRRFYDFHRDCGTGPVLNPFPLDASRRRRGRPNAHHNPMDEWRPERTGRSPTSGSTSCSRHCARTGTGPLLRSGSPPGPGPRSCWACGSATSARASS
jgi:hypothetical protein